MAKKKFRSLTDGRLRRVLGLYRLNSRIERELRKELIKIGPDLIHAGEQLSGSLRGLGRDAGLSRTYVSQVKQGHVRLSGQALERITRLVLGRRNQERDQLDSEDS